MSGTTNNNKKLFVVVARHGERWDYIQRDAGNNWIATAPRPWDPPLSPNGFKQATRLGDHLFSKLTKDLQLPPISAVYSSPFLRCRQTACQVVEALRNKQNSTNGSGQDYHNLKVKIEMGLSESLNESWYRSWALPGADGTWGFVPREDQKAGQRRALNAFSEEVLHLDSKRPAQELLLQWKNIHSENHSANLQTLQDMEYVSSTEITKSFALKPTLTVETKKEQQERMFQVIVNQADVDKTILLISHGGPVTHLYEKLSGNDWYVHGECTYCCYSIYQCEVPDKTKWEPIIVNESKYLDELWSDATSNI